MTETVEFKTALSVLYDRLCCMADGILQRRQPCQKCGTCEYHGGYKEGCCAGCPFLSEQGCTINCLGCKLWLCWDTHGVGTLAYHQLQRLRKIADRHGINFARATKEEVLSEEAIGKDVWHFYHTRNRQPAEERRLLSLRLVN